MTKISIAKAFSNGEFDKTFDFISQDAEWNVIEDQVFKGKEAIINNCVNVGNYFASVTTNFITLNIISEDNKIVINGTAEFLRDLKRISFISACDIYEFNDHNHIQKITSYCIQHK